MARTDGTTARVQALEARVRGLDAVFSCGGAVTLPAPVELGFHGKKPSRVAVGSHRDREALKRRLKKECPPAPFGVGDETRHDRRVRDGLQLMAHDGALAVLGLDLVQTGILEEVRRTLCPGASMLPDAELHALNVYLPGGHFVGHRDTPRDRACFGTLVVCLPVDFSGGRLVLRKDVTRVYDWHRSPYAWREDPEPYQVKWAAFYGDVEHEVERVTDGMRVTLTWLLRAPDGDALVPQPPAATELDLEAALREALTDPRFLAKGGTLGVTCTHLYAETEGLRRPADSMSEDTVARLKGRDRQVAFAALRAGLRVRCRPYLFETCAFEAWRLSRAPTEREARIFRKSRLGYSDLTEKLPIELDLSGYGSKDDVTWILPAPFDRPATQKTGVDVITPAEHLGAVEYSATDYFGNEAGDSSFYVAAVLLIEVPPAKERGAARSQ